MKVAFLSPFSSSALQNYIPELKNPYVPEGMGGSAVFELVKGLIEIGLDIHIITLQSGLAEVKEYHKNNVHYYIIPRRLKSATRDLWRMERNLIKDILNKIQPDVIHANWTYEYALAALRFNSHKTLITAHDIPFKVLRHNRSIYYLPLFMTSLYVYKKAKNLAFVSTSVKLYAEKFLNKDCVTEIIPNIIDISDYDITNSTGLKLPDNYFISIGLWGNLKNLKSSIEAFHYFQKKYRDYYYILIGPGLDDDSTCTDWMFRKGLQRNIILMGKKTRNETLTILKNALALLHPSLTEAHPMVIGEAMALGIPVIAGNNSDGATELVSNKKGLVCNVKNPKSIYTEMKKIIEHKDEVELIKSNSREFINSNCNLNTIINRYLNWYKQIKRNTT